MFSGTAVTFTSSSNGGHGATPTSYYSNFADGLIVLRDHVRALSLARDDVARSCRKARCPLPFLEAAWRALQRTTPEGAATLPPAAFTPLDGRRAGRARAPRHGPCLLNFRKAVLA